MRGARTRSTPWLAALLLLVAPGLSRAEESPELPTEAPPVGATTDRPPHPKTPEPLPEPQPTAEVRATTTYHWLPGSWTWTEKQFEWKRGTWIYPVEAMSLTPPRWEWSEERKQWLFQEAGWSKPGTEVVLYGTTAAPGGPDVVENPGKAPEGAPGPKQQRPAKQTAYVWTGVYHPPAIVYPPRLSSQSPAEQKPGEPSAEQPATAIQAPPSSSARQRQKNRETRVPRRKRPRDD